MLLFLALTQAASAIQPPADHPDSAAMAGLLSAGDYPKEALKNGWEGKVRVQVTVAIDGRPKDCKVVESSGYEVLDTKTCTIMLERARFKPAEDAAGHAVEATFVAPPVMWAIER